MERRRVVVTDRAGDAALRVPARRVGRVTLGEHEDLRSLARRGERRRQPRSSGTDYQQIDCGVRHGYRSRRSETARL